MKLKQGPSYPKKLKLCLRYLQKLKVSLHRLAPKPENSTLKIFKAKKRAAGALEYQAKRMKILSNNKQKPITVGDCVIVPMSDVDKAKSDLRNIIAIVMKKKRRLI
uniref:Uncharacterized protein n=1 Tax=Trichogramma kaykai TaxID=54128 RepID=A0ABD2WIG7_9HYME